LGGGGVSDFLRRMEGFVGEFRSEETGVLESSGGGRGVTDVGFVVERVCPWQSFIIFLLTLPRMESTNKCRLPAH
jgi:hypothetical protein